MGGGSALGECLWEGGRGGGAKYFFSGPKFPPSKSALLCRAKDTAQILEKEQFEDGPFHKVREGYSSSKSA